MKKNTFKNWNHLTGLIILLSLLITGCREAPDDIGKIENPWTVSIDGPTVAYVGDTISLTAVLTGNVVDYNQTAFDWIISDPDGLTKAYTGKKAKVELTKVGEYYAELEATDSDGETKTANLGTTANRRGVIISLGQTAGNYLSGDNLQFDSLGIYIKLIAAPDDSLGRFTLHFGDDLVLDTTIAATQTVLMHRYSDYGNYQLEFINDETIVKSFTIVAPDPDDDTTTVYDVDLAEYDDLTVPTDYPDAMFAQVDSVNNKFYLLISVTATERAIGPNTEITLKGNWEGNNYSDWTSYLTGTGYSLTVTTEKGRYLKLEINDYIEEFEYRGNIVLDDGNWINAQNMMPYYDMDLSIGDTGSIHLIIRNGKVIVVIKK
ncbi:TPA: hypothetical protein DCZ15_00855 [Candidatus Falkowbacteria bacterium]|nr:MAG: hypothetical protein UV95_C0003G0032 [Candidatus Falkowbacteria bacterium GW2011_GWF2_43_32]HBA36404.1 hypothetical protein [Candidatus Falkowbacteria bacterium]